MTAAVLYIASLSALAAAIVAGKGKIDGYWVPILFLTVFGSALYLAIEAL